MLYLLQVSYSMIRSTTIYDNTKANWERDLLQMIALRLEREVRGVLEWVVVPQRELDNTTVHT